MSRIRQLLGAAWPDAAPELDLHGHRVPEALEAVRATLLEAERVGMTELRIVCGKGLGSPGRRGVLRDTVAGWLEAHGYRGRFRREVDRDGRDAALRVDLRPSSSAGIEGP